MNAAVYSEPYKLPAGMLALVVHGAFFALLYFGFSWQTQQPETMSVELWQSLPDVTPEVRVEEVVPPQPVEEVVKPDIVIPDKKAKPEVVKPKPPEIKPEPRKRTEVSKVATQPAPAQPSAAEQQAARDKLAQEAATGRVINEFSGKIKAKVTRNVVMPPDVPNEARAEFLVTLLPGGRVLSARLTKPSGHAAYDAAVERAILKSDPLPLPDDASLFSRFRELKLDFKPVE